MPIAYRLTPRLALAACALAAAASLAAAESGPSLLRARSLNWSDTAGAKGARHAPIWGEAAAGNQAVLQRLPINTVIASDARPHDLRVLVLRGAISVEIAGREAGEFGPGSYLSVPRGTKHAFTTSAAGECTFLLQLAGTGGATEPVLLRARQIAWADTTGIKGAKHSVLAGFPPADKGVLHRLPINLPYTLEAAAEETRIVVQRGAIGVEIDGKEHGEFGPGSALFVPRGAKLVLTATAAGECSFFLQRAAATPAR